MGEPIERLYSVPLVRAMHNTTLTFKVRRNAVGTKKTLTTAFGIPVADDLNSLTAGQRGPVLMQDVHLLEKLAHFP